jgi:hypothetical protein
MATDSFPNLPGVTSTFQDGGLDIPFPVDLGESILIIGTAERGPLNQPVAVRNLDQAVEEFGSFTKGTLVRGIFEAVGVSQGGKDIRGMRVGLASKASLPLAELAGGGTTSGDDPSLDVIGSAMSDALVIQALYEGDQYNSVTVRTDVIGGKQSVVFYNPDTGIESAFSFDYVDDTADVDVHNLKELADAVNADPNLNEIIEVIINEMTADFAATVIYDDQVVSWSTGCYQADSKLYLKLSDRLNTVNVGVEDTGLPSGVLATATVHADQNANLGSAGNNIVELLEVYDYAITPNNAPVTDTLASSGTYGLERVVARGRDQADLAYAPAKTGSYTLNEDNYFADEVFDADGDGWTYVGTPVVRQVVRNGYVAIVESATTLDYTFDGVYADVENNGFRDTEVVLYKTVGTTKNTMAEYTVAYDGGTDQFTFTLPATGAYAPEVGAILTCDFVTNDINATEHVSKAAAVAGGNWFDLFVTGKKVYFGATCPSDLLVTYRYKRNMAIGGDVNLSNAQDGLFEFTNPNNTPKTFVDLVDGYAIPQARPHVIGFRYEYLPEWVQFTAAAQALKGGGNGIDMTKAQQYDALESGFENLANYEVDIITLMDAYLDDVKVIFDDDTAELIELNAGFQTLLGTLLDSLQEGVNETLGILSVKPAASKSLADINDWYEKLVVVDSTDPLRGANIIAALDNKWLSVCAFEPVFSNGLVTQPYSATGEAAYAGLLGHLPAHSAPTNKRMDNIVGLRYGLTKRQMDTLVGNRYVVARVGGNPQGVVVTYGVTAAAKGSDYTSVQTISIVKQAMGVVRDVSEPFIGEPNDDSMRSALDTAIRQGLQRMVEGHALRNFEFSIISSPAMQVIGELQVDLILVPAFELRKIRVLVKLSPSL